MKLVLSLDLVNAQFIKEKEYLLKQLEKKEHREVLDEEVIFSMEYATRIKPCSVQELLYLKDNPDNMFDSSSYRIGCLGVSFGRKNVVYPEHLSQQQRDAVVALLKKKWKEEHPES